MRNVPPHVQIIGDYSLIHKIASKGKVDRIIVALEERRGKFPTEALLKCRMEGIPVEEGISFYERLTGKLPVEKTYPSSLIFSNGFRKSPMTRTVKATIDYLLSVFALIICLPLIPLIALAIKIDSRGPIFYAQERVGRNGKIFKLLKFRSMSTDAERQTGPIWARKNDERITPVGRFIRKLRIDEIPQMINVLKGEMSFVGPRPERPHFVDQLKKTIPLYEKRHVIKPGITGWAQIEYSYGASENDALEKLKYDLYYIKHMSLFFDLSIIFRSVRAILFGRGAR